MTRVLRAVLLLALGAIAMDVRADDAFLAFLDQVDRAQLELQNGKADAYKAVWSHADDVTLAGGFGGTIEKGWKAIDARLDWVATQFSDGKTQRERVAVNAGDPYGYLVQHETVTYRVPGQEAESRRDYRVTMVFRKEKDGWRIVHRQADLHTKKDAPR